MSEWEQLERYCRGCTRCELSRSRLNVVVGRGNKDSKLMLIGEAPGRQEDEQGLPFVGKAGQLLDNLLDGIGITREDYYIANIIKCRPPNNRDPSDEEAEACLPMLRKQVSLIKPKVIVCLGRISAKYIIDKNAKITKIRGTWIERKGFMIMPTYHPAAVLRNANMKEPMWNDFKKVKEKMDL